LTDPLPSTALEQRLDSIIIEYLESVERGETANPARWLDRYPEFADELKAFFAAEVRFDRMVAPLRGTPTVAVASTDCPRSSVTDLPLRTVKDYDLLSEIGRGGMGVIYKACQRSLNRLVAIKMIRLAEWAGPQERSRFRWEAEAIAALDHPNIVPIYEIGEISSDDGTQLPFFSMKLIEGENLAQARDRFRNDWNRIARLMIFVTRAVEHAHQRGLLHRDLKPANVLLKIAEDAVSKEDLDRSSGFPLGTSFVVPHISDFGLARRTKHPRGQTLPGTVVGTPSYLAPELARGHEFATIASDVYSLGAILYEVLTGIPPFQADTPLETIWLVSVTGVKSPRKVNSAIPRDLETICLKCLETDPTRRYASADKLADDLEQFLACRPITARPTGRLERFGRWCRRQPVIAGLSAALILVVLIGLPLIIWNWQRALDQEQLAERRLHETQDERERADEGFALAHSAVEDIFRLLAEDRWEDVPGSEQSKKQLLEKGLKYYRTFVDRHRAEPKLRREVARATFRMGTIFARIGPKRDAVESYRTAVELLRPLTKEYPDEAALQELLAQSLGGLGNALSALNYLDEAIAAHDEAIALWASLQKQRADKSLVRKGEAAAWANRGVVFQGKEDWQAALDSFRKAAGILADLAKKGDVTFQERGMMARCMSNISQAENRLGHVDEAVRSADEAKKLAAQMAKENPRSENARFMLANTARAVGVLQLVRHDVDAARANLLAAVNWLDELHRERPRLAEYAWNLALVSGDLGSLEMERKNFADALKSLNRARLILRELVARDGESHPNRSSLARIETRLAEVHERKGDSDGARNGFEQARIHLEYLLNHGSQIATVRFDLARTCHQLGVHLGRLKMLPEAVAATEEAVKHYCLLLAQTPEHNSIVRKDFSSALGNLAIQQRASEHLTAALSATKERCRLWPGHATNLYDAATDFARTYDAAIRLKTDEAICSQARHLAIQTLAAAFRAGLPDRTRARDDPAFKMLGQTDEFQEFLKAAKE
jgi:eukaryotic-like serine/threonine-protein kinase